MSDVPKNGDDILVAENIRKEFGGLVASNDVDFTIPRGSVVSLIGPNGAGKTTFFNMLTGVYKPTAGRITFLGEDVTGKPPHAITSRGVGRTFQNIRLFQNMTALENVLVGMHARLKANLFVSILRTRGVKEEEPELVLQGALHLVEQALPQRRHLRDARIATAPACSALAYVLDRSSRGHDIIANSIARAYWPSAR